MILCEITFSLKKDKSHYMYFDNLEDLKAYMEVLSRVSIVRFTYEWEEVE